MKGEVGKGGRGKSWEERKGERNVDELLWIFPKL